VHPGHRPDDEPVGLKRAVALATLWPTTFGTETVFEFARIKKNAMTASTTRSATG